MMVEEGCRSRGTSSDSAMGEEATMVTGAMEAEEGEEVGLVWKKEHQGSQAWDKVDLRTPVQGAVEKSQTLETGWGGAPTMPTVEEVAGLASERGVKMWN